MKIPSIPTGCEDYDDYVRKSGAWLIYEEQMMQEARFEEMPTDKEKDSGKQSK